MKQVARLVSVGIRSNKVSKATTTSRASVQLKSKLTFTSRTYATQAFPKVSPQQLYWVARTAEPIVLLDARPADKFNAYRVQSFVNVPAASTTLESLADFPTERNVYIMGDYPNLAGAEQVAQLVKSKGAQNVYILEGSTDMMKEAGFFYYHDEEMENERIAKEKAEALAKQQAAAAAQKK